MVCLALTSLFTEGEKLIETIGAEVLPIALRSRVMGLAAASHFIVNVGITEAGPSAFSHVSFLQWSKKPPSLTPSQIKENYYYVFVACSSFFFVVAYLYFPYVYFLCIAYSCTQDTLVFYCCNF
jgi:hypothetical protein